MTIDQGKIDTGLASMSAWSEAPAGLWQAALESTRPVRRHRLSRPAKIASAAGVLVLLVMVVGAILPSLGKARASARSIRGDMTVDAQVSSPSVMAKAEQRNRAPSTVAMGYAGEPPPSMDLPPASAAPVVPGARGNPQVETNPAADRMVIRKATIELKTRDVRGVFVKSAQVLSEAQGEYIESSTLSGEGENTQGTLTLRVSAARLSALLNSLRGLAEVTSENATGEDITDQFVDLEARLRNEQRVETELLDLLASRKEAPLREVLELRDSISRVRESIERMAAQKERLSRLVSLATVLVIIRPDSTKPAPIPDGLGGYFMKQLRASWQSSLTFLADSIAFLLRVLVGGAVFWVAAAVVIAAILMARRRAIRRLGREPAPAL